MKYKKGRIYEVNAKNFGKMNVIYLSSTKDSYIFQTLGDEEFNERIYCNKDYVVYSKEMPKSKLFYYLGTKDADLLSQIFLSLKK